MVKIALQIKANLECVERVTTCHPQYEWFLQMRCNGCGETSPTWHDVTEDERTSHKHGRSDTNYLAKCKLCSRENSLEILQGTNGEYLSGDSGKFKTIVVFECRGIEPVDFSPRKGWNVVSEENGTKFNDVDLTEKEWVEYDEKNNTSESRHGNRKSLSSPQSKNCDGEYISHAQPLTSS
ncbi:UPF0587 protein CG4646 isoform X2 [Arctopsyche grandis]|uniref:UPF0587 protein CG4646 isoform X2 n=1 Tax=Arctopsyche grandis TaxID=121162 RepID=UPI00406D6979